MSNNGPRTKHAKPEATACGATPDRRPGEPDRRPDQSQAQPSLPPGENSLRRAGALRALEATNAPLPARSGRVQNQLHN